MEIVVYHSLETWLNPVLCCLHNPFFKNKTRVTFNHVNIYQGGKKTGTFAVLKKLVYFFLKSSLVENIAIPKE